MIFLATLVLVLLKVVGIIHLSWLTVLLAPLVIGILLAFVMFVVVGGSLAFVTAFLFRR